MSKIIMYIMLIFSFTMVYAENIPEYSQFYDAKRNAFADGIEAIKKAQNENKKIIISIGGNWCPWCMKLERFIHTDSHINANLYTHFVILKINVSDENKNKAFLSLFPKLDGYPHYFVTSASGEVLHSQDTTEFLANGNYSQQYFNDFLERWK